MIPQKEPIYWIKYLLLSIVPVSVILVSLSLHYSQGPWYLNFYDPSYVYLFSSLNLSQGIGVVHTDHPGTTLQLIGAVTVKLFYLLAGKNNSIAADVISRPETYLTCIHSVLLLLNGLGVLIVGLTAYKLTKSISFAALLQLFPLTSREGLFSLIAVTPENLLIFVQALVICLILKYAYSEEDTDLKFVVYASAVCAFGIITKINFVPVIAMFLVIIKSVRRKTIFLGLVILFGLVLFLPAIDKIGKTVAWVGGLITKSGIHGTGESNFLVPAQFLASMLTILESDPFFTISLFIGIGSLIYLSVNKRSVAIDALTVRKARALTGIIITMVLQLLLVAKHYSQIYMLPSLLLSCLALILSMEIVRGLMPQYKGRFTPVHLVLSAVVCISVYLYFDFRATAENQRIEAERIIMYMKSEHINTLVVPAFQSADKDCALLFGIAYSGTQSQRYKDLLLGHGSKTLFYNPWTADFISLDKNPDPFSKLSGRENLIVQLGIFGKAEEIENTLRTKYGYEFVESTELIENKYGEKLYRIRMTDSDNVKK